MALKNRSSKNHCSKKYVISNYNHENCTGKSNISLYLFLNFEKFFEVKVTFEEKVFNGELKMRRILEEKKCSLIIIFLKYGNKFKDIKDISK